MVEINVADMDGDLVARSLLVAVAREHTIDPSLPADPYPLWRSSTRFAWDGLGRLLTVRNALGEETRLAYTGPTAGLAEPETAPPGRWLTRLERGWTETEGAGQIQRLRTDARGDLVAIERRDDAGLWSVFATFASDSDGNRLTATDALGQTTRFVYDGKEQLVSVTGPADDTITIDPRL